MDAFAMTNSCSSKASSISLATEESHKVITNTKKMKAKIMEDSQLKPNELSSPKEHIDLKVRNDYNNEKNLTLAHASEPSNENTPTQRSSSKTKISLATFARKNFPLSNP